MSYVPEEINADEQAAAMAAIVARFPRKVFASLAECGGDETVQVERIEDQGPAQWKANRKDEPYSVSGWGATVDEAIVDLWRSEAISADLQHYGGGFPHWTQKP